MDQMTVALEVPATDRDVLKWMLIHYWILRSKRERADQAPTFYLERNGQTIPIPEDLVRPLCARGLITSRWPEESALVNEFEIPEYAEWAARRYT